MQRPRFTSEFDDADLPNIDGEPWSSDDARLVEHSSSLPYGVRLEQAQQVAILDAVRVFYIAKYLRRAVLNFSGYTNAVSRDALDLVSFSLLKQAVVTVASVNDLVTGRTKSLPHAMDAIKRELELTDSPESRRARRRLKEIKKTIDADSVTSLKYVRHIRNKWAGHASLDTGVDKWADADQYLQVPLVEAALVALVNAHQDVAALVENTAILAPERDAQVQSNVRAMTVAWGQVVLWAEVMRSWGERAAEAIVDQMGAPPGYGDESNTDWRTGSAHAELRRRIDQAAEKNASDDR